MNGTTASDERHAMKDEGRQTDQSGKDRRWMMATMEAHNDND